MKAKRWVVDFPLYLLFPPEIRLASAFFHPDRDNKNSEAFFAAPLNQISTDAAWIHFLDTKSFSCVLGLPGASSLLPCLPAEKDANDAKKATPQCLRMECEGELKANKHDIPPSPPYPTRMCVYFASTWRWDGGLRARSPAEFSRTTLVGCHAHYSNYCARF